MTDSKPAQDVDAKSPEVGGEAEDGKHTEESEENAVTGVRFDSDVQLIANTTVDFTQSESTGSQQQYEVQAAHEIGEVLFLASIGNLPRLQAVLQQNGVDISSDKSCDYDKRTALHVAADNGNYAVADWLIQSGAPINAIDRFNLTPLASASRSQQKELIKLIQAHGGLVLSMEGELVPLKDSELKDLLNPYSLGNSLVDEWEIDANRVRLLKVIGDGHYGQVYLANWNGTICVSKMVKKTDLSSPTVLAEFRSEISLQHRLHHPNVLQFFGVVMKQPIQIIIEYMDAGSLKEAFSSLYCFGHTRALVIAMEIIKGLIYLHEREPRPIIHRDIKPGNLLMKKSGEVKIADFGISRTLKKQTLNEAYTLTGETGTYRYMAPEVYRHESYDTSVDVYSYALVVYQCFSWETPFVGLEGLEACKRAAEGLRPTSSTQPLPQGIATILAQCWHQEAAQRPTALEVLHKLEEFKENSEQASNAQQPCCIAS